MRVKRAKRQTVELSDEAKAFLENPTPQDSLMPAMWECVMAGYGVATTSTDDTRWTFVARRAASAPA